MTDPHSTVQAVTLEIQMQADLCTPHFALWTVISGTAQVSMSWGKFSVKPLSIFSTAPDEAMTIVPGEGFVLARLDISSELLQDAFQSPTINLFCNSALGMDCSMLHPHIIRIVEEQYYDLPGSRLRVLSQLYELLYLLQQNFSLDTVVRGHAGPQELTGRKYQIAQYIALHYSEPLSLDAIARQFHLTPQYFSKYFKQSFGDNFLTYLRDVRLTHAAKALIALEDSVTGIAYANGFPNLAAFNKAFRTRYGLSPRQFADQYAPKPETEQDRGVKELDSGNALSLLHEFTGQAVHTDADIAPVEELLVVNAAVSADRAVPFAPKWTEIVNVGPANRCLTNDFLLQFRSYAQRVHPRYVRILDIFTPDIFPGGLDAESPDFHVFDRLIDLFRSEGCHMMFEMGPRPVREIFSPQLQMIRRTEQNIAAQTAFISVLVRHCLDRLGIEEVSQWRFENWLPQMEELYILDHAPADFCKNFSETYRIIKSMVPQAEVGVLGLNVNVESPELVLELLHRLRDMPNVRPDFVSFYLYPKYISKMDPMTRSVRIDGMLRTDIDDLRSRFFYWEKLVHSVFPDIRIYISEYSSDLTSRFSVNESGNKGAFIADFLINNFDCADSFGYCLLSDLASESYKVRQPLSGGNGLITQDALNRPAFYAFSFIARLGDQLLSRGRNYIVTGRGRHRYEILLHNHKNLSSAYCTELFKADNAAFISPAYFEDDKRLHITLTITDIQPGVYQIKTRSISRHNNLLWGMKQLNDTRLLSNEELEYLRSICIPSQRLEYLSFTDALTLSYTLEPDEVALLTVTFFRQN